MSRTPAWVEQLVERVLADEKIEVLPSINWRRAHGRDMLFHDARGSYRMPDAYKPITSSGRCSYDTHTITITAGSSRLDAKLVLLHELAHYVVGKGHAHDLVFWTKCFVLFRRYGVRLRYALAREKSYRKGALAGYRAAQRLYQSDNIAR